MTMLSCAKKVTIILSIEQTPFKHWKKKKKVHKSSVLQHSFSFILLLFVKSRARSYPCCDLAFTQVKNIWLGCSAQGSFMTVWRLPEAPFTCIQPIPLSCALRNSAFGLQVRVISRQYIYIYIYIINIGWEGESRQLIASPHIYIYLYI